LLGSFNGLESGGPESMIRMELEESTLQTLAYTTKLQSSKQFGTYTKTEIYFSEAK